MQTKRLILLITIATALGILLISPTHAVGEEGTGTLCVYTDPKRTTLTTIDAEGRYVTVPGTEYYFTVSGITEYNVGTSITIWVYRTNTAENIEVGNFEINSMPFDAIFTWTIPDDWLDEVVKIKYGTNLENDWLFAKKEIWVNARVGTGVLYTEAPFDGDENYLVYPGATYVFTIEDIEYVPPPEIKVWAHYKIATTTYDIEVTPPPSYIDGTLYFQWTIPSDMPINTAIKFKYGNVTEPKGPLPNWVYARRETISAPRLLLVIPEVFLGSAGTIAALFSGLGITTLIRKRH